MSMRSPKYPYYSSTDDLPKTSAAYKWYIAVYKREDGTFFTDRFQAQSDSVAETMAQAQSHAWTRYPMLISLGVEVYHRY